MAPRDGYGQLFPYLMVADAEGLVGLVKDVFGAEEVSRTMQGDRLANVELRIGATGFMVSESPDMLAPAALYIYVDDVDATHASALEHGCEELFAPADMDYEDRQSGVRDPFGNLWFISAPLTEGTYAH